MVSTERLMFGNHDDESVCVDGVNVFAYINEIVGYWASALKSDSNLLLQGKPVEYCLHPYQWVAKYMEWKLENAVIEYYERRVND